jgi:hypothetical protein
LPRSPLGLDEAEKASSPQSESEGLASQARPTGLVAAKQIRRIREPGEAGRPCRRKAKPKVSRVTR